MNTKIELPFAAILKPRRVAAGSSPSLRIAATRKNRSLLRWMRAAELAAWQDADARDFAAPDGAGIMALPQPLFRMNTR